MLRTPPTGVPRLLHGVGLASLLVGTAVLYLWGLSASGYANSYYSAAVQAGSQSWTAFLFGSLDAGNAITVDKPPASLWLMALSVRIFGLSSWSILVPQALLGVASVAVLYASVRRTSGHAAGLVAGALLALTPVATLMFRFNNPDALLIFLLVAAAYATLRATERASGKWLAGAGVLVGFAFLTKMLQAFLVLPAFALVYLLVAPTPLRRRLLHLLGALAATIVSAGWWVALVELVPASWRPYVGGSETNSVLELIFGYNGLGRIFGNGGGGGPGGGGASFGSYAGLTRMFEGVSGGMVSWLSRCLRTSFPLRSPPGRCSAPDATSTMTITAPCRPGSGHPAGRRSWIRPATRRRAADAFQESHFGAVGLHHERAVLVGPRSPHPMQKAIMDPSGDQCRSHGEKSLCSKLSRPSGLSCPRFSRPASHKRDRRADNAARQDRSPFGGRNI